MKFFLVVALIFILNITLNAQWVNRYNGTGNSDDMAYSTVVDPFGNIIVAGKSIGTFLSNFDYVIIKYNSSGSQQWVQRYNSSELSADYPFSLATDPIGNIYVTGNSNGTTTIKYNPSGVQQWVNNNSTFIANSISVDQNSNVFVTGTNGNIITVKYNTLGVQQWIKTSLPGTAKQIISDNSGNVYVTGGGGEGTDNVTIKYNSQGDQQWIQRYITPYSDMSHSIAVDLSGNVYSSGRTWAAFGSWYNTVKYNSSGVQQWNQSYNYVTPYGFSSDWANSVAVDGNGNVYTAGGTWNGTSRDIALIKYNALGSQQWIQTYNGPGNDFDMASAIGIDGSGNIYVTGMSKGIGTAEDFVTIKYNSFGVEQWVERYNGPGNGEDRTSSISVSAGGNVVVTGRSWNGINYDFATIKYSQQTQPISQPSISISPIQINPGGSVSITGQNFRANAQVKVSVTSSNSENVLDQTIPTNSNGGFSTSYSSNANSSPGFYSVSCRDIVTNQSAPNRIFEVKQPLEVFPIRILSPRYPTLEEPEPDSVDKIINIEWVDKMITGTEYTISGSKRNYKYLLIYSTDNGITWEDDSTFISGSEFVNSTPLFRAQVNLESSFSYRGGLYVKFQVMDFLKPSRNDNTVSLPVRLNTLTRASLNLIWDYSYPKDRIGNPIGACADGVSRFYIKVSKVPGNILTGVSLNLTDDIYSTDKRVLGKLAKANVTDQYNNEANNASSTSYIDNTSKDDYWVWYVSPDDFNRYGATDDTKIERIVKLNVTVYYSSGLPEAKTISLKIIRQPLMLVHGFNSDHHVWDDFIRNKSIKSLFKFYSTPNLDPKGTYNSNALLLLNYLQTETNHYQSFKYIINKARQSGYASNQVSYVSHSMGGCVVRAAAQLHYFKDNLNYNKGFVNRIITVDTPHDGSPLADLVVNFISHFPIKARILAEFLESDLIRSTYRVDENYNVYPSGSVLNLQAEGYDRYNFYNTNIPSYLIAGDLFPGSSNEFGNIDWNTLNVNELDKHLNSLELILEQSSKLALRRFFYNPEDYPEVKNLIKNNNMNRIEKMCKLFNLFCNKYLVTDNYLANSDFVVSVESQLSGTERSNFNTFDHYNDDENSLGIGHTFYNECTKDEIIANNIISHLNLPATSENHFIPYIPATKFYNSPVENNLPSTFSIESYIDNNLNIISPEEGKLCIVDSLLSISFSLDNNDSLKYVSITFQGAKYYDTSKASSYNFNIPVNGNDLDSCILYVNAVFVNGDSIEIFDDYKKLFVKSNYPVVDFKVSNNFLNMINNETIVPDYNSTFSNHIYKGVMNNITAIIEDPSIILFNNIDKSFKAISNGGTFAIVSNGGLSDTIYFNVNGEIITPGNAFLIDPNDSAIVSSFNLKFEWNAIEHAFFYNFQIAKDINFQSIIFEKNDLSDTTVTISSVEDSITYYWRVKGINSAGSGEWSTIRNFIAMPLKKSYLIVNLLSQGLYNETTNTLNRSDTVTAYLMNSTPPFNVIDSSRTVIKPVIFECTFEFDNAPTGNYMIKVNHMNSIETWSKASGELFTNESKNYYDFTKSETQAYGNNLILKGTKYCIYSGDVNQDGSIDLTDVVSINNDATVFSSGFLVTDLNGDYITDLTDLLLGFNNSSMFIVKITP